MVSAHDAASSSSPWLKDEPELSVVGVEKVTPASELDTNRIRFWPSLALSAQDT